ncbi:MAG: hypothetical protein ACLFWB_00235 [Armatimonadota bacterium]
MTWLDFLTIGLLVVFMGIEVSRGAVCAMIDTVGAYIALQITKFTYHNFVSESITESTAIAIEFGVLLFAVIAISHFTQQQMQADIGPFDSAVAAVLGVFVGLCAAHMAFHAVFVGEGARYAAFADSVMRGQVYELAAVKGFLQFMEGIGGTDIGR